MADIADSFMAAGTDPQLAALAGDGRPAFLFDRTGTRLVWVNGAGAAWLGARSAADVAARRFAPEHPTTRRIAALGGQLSSGQARTERIALPKGLIPQPVVCRASRVILNAERLVLLVVADGTGRLGEADAAAAYGRMAGTGGQVAAPVVATEATNRPLEPSAGSGAPRRAVDEPRPQPAPAVDHATDADRDVAELVESTLAAAAQEAAEAHYAAVAASDEGPVQSASGIAVESLPDFELPGDDEIVQPPESGFDAVADDGTGTAEDTEEAAGAAEAEALAVGAGTAEVVPDAADRGSADTLTPDATSAKAAESDSGVAQADPSGERGDGAPLPAPDEVVEPDPVDAAAETPEVRAVTPDEPADDGAGAVSAPAESRPEEGGVADDGAPAGDEGRAIEVESFSPPTHGRAVRFVFELDGGLAFGFVSDDLATAVGPAAAEVVGRDWSSVAAGFGLDPLGRVDAALRRRDTFTGLTVDWPVQDAAARMPVDLAGMPVFGRDRSFRGYRGFGIAKTGAIFAAPMIVPAASHAATGWGDRELPDETAEAAAPEGMADEAVAASDDVATPIFDRGPPSGQEQTVETETEDDTRAEPTLVNGWASESPSAEAGPTADEVAGELAVADAPALVDDVEPMVIESAFVAEAVEAEDLGTEWTAEIADADEETDGLPAAAAGEFAPVAEPAPAPAEPEREEPDLADVATSEAPALVEDITPVVIRDEAPEFESETSAEAPVAAPEVDALQDWALVDAEDEDGLRALDGVPSTDPSVAPDGDALPEEEELAAPPSGGPAGEPTELTADIAGDAIPEDRGADADDAVSADGAEPPSAAAEGDPRETPEAPGTPSPETEPAPPEQPEQPAKPQEAPEEPGVPAEPGPEYPAPSPEPAPEKAPAEAPGELPPEMPIERPDEVPDGRPVEEPAGMPTEEPGGMPTEVPGPGSMPSEFSAGEGSGDAPAAGTGAVDGAGSMLREDPSGPTVSVLGEDSSGLTVDDETEPKSVDAPAQASAADVGIAVGEADLVEGIPEADEIAWREAEPQTAEVIPSPIVPRSVPKTDYTPEETDRRQLSRPEREAFQKIAEALGARLEGAPPPDRDFELGGMRFERSAFAEEPAVDETDAFARSVPPSPAGFSFDAALLDKVPVPLAILKDGEAVSVNRAFLDLTGYPDLAALQAAGGFAETFAGSALPRDATLPAIRRRDGIEVPVSARLHSIPFGDGVASLMVVQDVAAATGRDRAASAEQRVEELEAILDTATDGVLVLDPKGTVVGANRSAEALFGSERASMIGEPLIALLAPESHRSALDYLDGLNRNGLSSLLNDGREVIGRVKQGGLVPLFMTVGRIASGRFCAVLRDITQWKRAEEELTAAKRSAETASSQKSDFLAKISHEIRTPLNAIIGFSEVMMEERFGPVGSERYKEYLRDIHISGAHIMSLVNDLLDLSKIEAGKLDLSFEAVSINDVIRECVALMQPQANRERIIIRTSLSSSLPAVVADNRSLRQIVLNLLSNAIKFNNPGGQVIVSTLYEDTGEVAIRVRDTGPGMSEDDIAKALEPFRQLHTARPGRGTGLGLPLTKALVEANRAGFRIDSAVGQGTLVQITFPSTRVLAE